MKVQRKRRFVIVFGRPGRMEFKSFTEAMTHCMQVNGVGIYDLEQERMELNQGYQPDPGITCEEERKRRERLLEMAVYCLMLAGIGCILLVLLFVR